MNFDELLRQKAQKEPAEVPESFSKRVRETLDQLPNERAKVFVWNKRGLWKAASAAVLAVLFILPNTSVAMAETLGDLPVVGPLFQVITVRTYEDRSGDNHISISDPQIVDEQNRPGAQEINAEVEQYIDELIQQYEQTGKENGYFNLDVTWEIITNTDRWFTLKINTDLVLASGKPQRQYYHIDPVTGEQKTLSDLFPKDFDYIHVISEELKDQMKERMEENPKEVYWLKGISQLGDMYFDTISPDQDFYFDDEGQIVITFDKYEVGPGSTGSTEFTLESLDLYDHLLVQP